MPMDGITVVYHGLPGGPFTALYAVHGHSETGTFAMAPKSSISPDAPAGPDRQGCPQPSGGIGASRYSR